MFPCLFFGGFFDRQRPAAAFTRRPQIRLYAPLSALSLLNQINSASLVLRYKCSCQCTPLRAFIRRNDRRHVSIISGLVSIARIMSWGSVLLRVQNIIIISLCYLGTHDPIIMAHAVFAHYLISFHSFLSLNGRFGAYSR